MDFVDWVYDTLNGQMAEGYEAPGVETVFAQGSYCDECYERMRVAYSRLCNRLGAINEDKDVETIISNLENIQKEMCRKMYHYGAVFGNKDPG